jgi:esterase
MSSVPSPAPLAVTRIAASDQAARHVVMLHGIYGRGRNWQGVAKALTDARPEYACWLVDLPHHGGSGAGTHGETIAGFAQDVLGAMTARGVTPDVVLGHSFGGKVALAAAPALADRALEIWVIDSTPEVKAPSGTAWTMMNTLRRLPQRFASRDAAQKALVAAGYELGVAQWMTTNLVRDGDGFVWQLDFALMERLLRDFFTVDLWHVVEQPSPLHQLHFLKASRSGAMSGEAMVRLEKDAGPQVHLHHLEGGHWIHAERPDAVTALLARHLP